MNKLVNQIHKAFAKSDVQSLLKLQSSIIAKRAKYKELQKKGDKTIYLHNFWEEMKYGEKAQIQRAIKKAIAMQDARNYRIAKKLSSKDIKSIDLENVDIVWGNDFETICNIGQYQITLRVIYAGGYAVQELHQRVLCNVKKVA
jgi:formate dehydrogenase maturation protein FdhE